MPATSDRYRLPASVVPSRYELELEPDLDAATFTGTVAIAVEVREPVSEIVLNADALTIDEAWVAPVDGTAQRLDVSVAVDEELERVTLSLPGVVDLGAHVVHLRFHGALNDKLTGFYRSTYTDAQGTERTIAVTQFEATHARKAFPCWDEPAFKAVFRITLVVDEALTAVSNGAVVSDEATGDGRRRVRFADTMPMSTYIVAWVVGPMEATAPVDAGTPLRIVHPPGAGELTAFSLDSASFALRWFTAYYAIPYPGDKCDLVAVPDFAFGAMENLGCITFREVLLLADPERATQPELQRIADVVHHELAHMWFGNLVTMKWWNGIWLNEAFATFMETKCTDAFRPEWDRWTDFGLSRSAAFDIDALASTRPIEFEVVSPEDAEGMFDVLTYEKGAAVLRMLEQFLGEDAFRDGIRRYLAQHSYANTETTDLWDAIEAATGEPVRHIMDTWIFQGGYPQLSVELDGRSIVLRQERFQLASGGGDAALDGRWAVPVLLRYGRGEDVRDNKVLLDELEERFELELEPEWVLVNRGGSGFYRVRYTADQRAGLASRLRDLTPLERYQLLDDAHASMLAGGAAAAELLELLRHFADDEDLSVWQRISGTLAVLERIVDDEARPRFAATARALAAPALTRMGHEPHDAESDRTRQLRATLFELLGTTGADGAVLERARAIHDRQRRDPASVDPELAAASINVIAENGNADDYQAFLDHLAGARNPQEEIRYLYALGRFRDEGSFRDVLERALSTIRTQNAPFVLARALMNRRNGPVAWDVIRSRWDDVTTRFPTSTVPRLVEGVRGFVDPEVADDVEAFFAAHPVPQGAKTVAQHLERMRVNVALRQREGAALAAALP